MTEATRTDAGRLLMRRAWAILDILSRFRHAPKRQFSEAVDGVQTQRITGLPNLPSREKSVFRLWQRTVCANRSLSHSLPVEPAGECS